MNERMKAQTKGKEKREKLKEKERKNRMAR
jgi:hypothetical protein